MCRARSYETTALVVIDRWTLAEELWAFGEDDYVQGAIALTDEQMVEVWRRAGEIYIAGEARSGGEAASMAGVETLGGRRRPLARTRRRPRAGQPDFGKTEDERSEDTHRVQAAMEFPHAWT
jgi:hypothetical protein